MTAPRGKRPFWPTPLPVGAFGGRPMVAVVGRPNVGKSTLFNRLAGKRIAIVEDRPGVTRDRHYADAHVLGRDYVIIDTGGFDPESDDPMRTGIASQVGLAIDECELVVCVLDATTDPTPADRETIRMLRSSKRPVIYVANKADSQRQTHLAMGLYELGIDSMIPVSALHGQGMGELEDAIAGGLPPAADEAELNPHGDLPRIALIGRPNAGKSSLTNRLLGKEQQLVDARPGTTVDSIDSLFEHRGQEMVLIDTAGIRRKRSVQGGIEGLAVIQAIRALERSDVAVLLIDADAGPAEQDAKITGLVEERGRALIIALNKGDLLDAERRKRAITRTREILAFVPWAEVVTISAHTGRGVTSLIEKTLAALESHRKRVGTAEVNRFFEEVLDRHPPPTARNRPVRLYYVTQAQTRPPTFMVVTNAPRDVHFSYQRYVINQIRERFGFVGTPVRVRYRAKKKKVLDPL